MRTDEQKEKHRLYMKLKRKTPEDIKYRHDYYQLEEVKARQAEHNKKPSYKARTKKYIRRYMREYNQRDYVKEKAAKKKMEAKE